MVTIGVRGDEHKAAEDEDEADDAERYDDEDEEDEEAVEATTPSRSTLFSPLTSSIVMRPLLRSTENVRQ
jgi:hypothetical protein